MNLVFMRNGLFVAFHYYELNHTKSKIHNNKE